MQYSFNTQPRKGGCDKVSTIFQKLGGFQHTAARRRLHLPKKLIDNEVEFQHTAARRRLLRAVYTYTFVFNVSTHSRAKAAAYRQDPFSREFVFQHTAARRRLQNLNFYIRLIDEVSTHSRTEAAAISNSWLFLPFTIVSTHSRTEAAAKYRGTARGKFRVSTHSRTEAAAKATLVNGN